MTPAARYAAAIDVLDAIFAGAPAEQVLTGWGRKNRYAGSKDRAAIRDHVFDALRRKRSYGAIGGSMTGRGVVLGAIKHAGIAPETIFSGEGYAPSVLSEGEADRGREPKPLGEQMDLPDWLADLFHDSFGESAFQIAQVLKERAPIAIRVNLAKTTLETCRKYLLENDIDASIVEICDTALLVRNGARKLRNTQAFQDGLFELQDAASQAVVTAIELTGGERILDYCAGGGGKTLALAARSQSAVDAYDIQASRMADLPIRAARAGAQVYIVTVPEGTYDVVLCDAPCSGSGAWRRSPAAKWDLTAQTLQNYQDMQMDVLQAAQEHVAAQGTLIYATCSILPQENEQTLKRFISANTAWRCIHHKQFDVTPEHDGFFTAHLKRE